MRYLSIVWVLLFYLSFITSNIRIRIYIGDDETINKNKAAAESKGRKRQDEIVDGRLPECTTRQSGRLLRQLPPKGCFKSIKNPWTRKCSFAMATKTLNATWLTDYYKELYDSSDPTEFHDPFVGIKVGCGEGVEALDTLRMGTFNEKLDKTVWRNTLDDLMYFANAEGHNVMNQSAHIVQKKTKACR